MSSAAEVAKLKSEFVRLIGAGRTVKQACELLDVSESTFTYHQRKDTEFASNINHARAKRSRTVEELNVIVPDFPEFSEVYLGQKLFPHQLQWFDLLEGREPRDMHESMTYKRGRPSRLIVNTPPGHAKSTTITVNYAVWRIVKNPDIKIIIVSKGQRLAEQFLLQIKERLTSPQYEKLQLAFAPAGGWKDGSASWKATQFYVGGRGSEAKDPTVQALGMRGQIYGSRSDLIIVDDAVDNTNVGEFDKQVDWLLGMVGSRLAPRTGNLFVIGTRIAAKDLYSELLNPTRYYGGSSPWTHFQQPAVLEYADDPRDWLTLWPFSDSPADPDEMPMENGLYRRWDGPTLSDVRDSLTPAQWSRMYQQEQVSEDSVFNSELVAAACQMRHPGFVPDDAHVGRAGGMNGLRLVAGLDPASVGHTAAVLVGLDMKSGHRYVIDVHNEPGMTPDKTKNLILDWTDRYGVDVWVVERNAFQAFLTRDPDLLAVLASRGSRMLEHQTGNNKHDPDFGVMAMSLLFQHKLIHLPNSSSGKIKTLIEQLVTWTPKPPKSLKTDIVMALWFTEIYSLEQIMKQRRKHSYRDSAFMTRGDLRMRAVGVASTSGSVQEAASIPRRWWGT